MNGLALAASTGAATSALPVQLFGPAHHLASPAIAWNTSSFTQVDDSVRGGSSSSHVALNRQGALEFAGFLDTLTLGGAGFASQRYIPSSSSSAAGQGTAFPIALDSKNFDGLQLRIIAPPRASHPHPEGQAQKQPGGGKGPVTTYVMNLYTTEPKKRPDGRQQSSLVYEWDFTPAAPAAQTSNLVTVQSKWSDFRPKYRGRPQPDAPPLNPAEIKTWSFMARSDFGEQSGDFDLVVDSMWAIPRPGSSGDSGTAGPKSISEKSRRGMVQQPYGPTSPLHSTNAMAGARGFALYVFSTMLLLGWVMWALIPDRWLHAAGITWYPSRQWAFVLPAWSMILVLFVYAAYMGINLSMTPALDDVSTLTDPHARLPFASQPGQNLKVGGALMDIPRAQDMTWHEARSFYLEHAQRQALQATQQRRDDGMPDIYDLPPSAALSRFQRP
ncbi:unnamed protein product [Parajaminaea phylloscopi]